jgi:hypothetical protein
MNDLLHNFDPEQFTLLSFLFALAVADGLTADETNSLGNFFSTVGSALQLLAAQQQLVSQE